MNRSKKEIDFVISMLIAELREFQKNETHSSLLKSLLAELTLILFEGECDGEQNER